MSFSPAAGSYHINSVIPAGLPSMKCRDSSVQAASIGRQTPRETLLRNEKKTTVSRMKKTAPFKLPGGTTAARRKIGSRGTSQH